MRTRTDSVVPTRRLSRGDRVWLGSFVVLFALLCLYPNIGSSYGLSVVRDALLFGLFALSLDYLWGKTGTLSFGHAAFFGMGAYAMAIVMLNTASPISSLIGLLAAVALAGAVAAAVGYFLIFGDVRGPYFTIVTLAMTVIAQQVAISWTEVTGGDSGLVGIPAFTVPWFSRAYEFSGDLPFYFLVLGICSVALLSLWFACRGHYGRILAAIQDNEARARALGYHTSRHLLLVFVLSAMLAAGAGAIYATGTGFVAPDLIGLILSTEVIVWVAVGGRGTLIGPFIGAFVVLRLQQEVSSINVSLWPLFIGVFFVCMVFLFPDGVLTIARWAGALWARRSKSGKSEPA